MGKGNQAVPTSTYQAQSNLPPYAEPYYRELLENARNITFDPSGAFRQMPQYGGDRTVDYTRLQGFPEYQQAVTDASSPSTNFAWDETISALDLAKNRAFFDPGSFQSGYRAWQYSPSSFQAPSVSAPEFGLPQQQQVATIDPSASGNVTAERATVGAFTDPGVSDRYMSPYMRAVTDQERQRARQSFEEQRAGRNARAIQAGAFGGSRQAVAESEAERALQAQLGDIEARGAQNAFTQAQQQYERDRGASLAAQQMNIAGGLQAQLANQGTGLQALLANQQALEGASSRNLAAQLQTQGLASSQDLQAQLANQQASQGLQALAENSRQFGATFGEGSAARQSQMDLGAQQQTEAARQYAQDLYLRAGQGTLSAAQEMSRQRDLEQQLATRRTASLRDYLALQQGQAQQGLDVAYQDWQQSRDFPQYMLGVYQNILRGLPVQPTSMITTYEPPPNPFAQTAGLGLAALGLR